MASPTRADKTKKNMAKKQLFRKWTFTVLTKFLFGKKSSKCNKKYEFILNN